MPMVLPEDIYKWMHKLSVLKDAPVPPFNQQQQIIYDDQIYLENGYLIGILLKKILKNHQYHSEALLKIRKIAFLSSNQNWAIVKEIMEVICYEPEIDIHKITHPTILDILQYLYNNFGITAQEKLRRKQKKMHLDPLTYEIQRPLKDTNNLLQFMVSLIGQSFSLKLSDCLGLLISNCKYLKQIIEFGTIEDNYSRVFVFYHKLLQNIETFNTLILAEPIHLSHVLQSIASGVLSQSEDICELTCFILENLEESEWMNNTGYSLLLKSTHTRALDLLLKVITPNFQTVFNQTLHTHFFNKRHQMTQYTRIINQLPKWMYLNEILGCLGIQYYLDKALYFFDPEIHLSTPKSLKMAAKQLLSAISIHFWTKIGTPSKNLLLFAFDQMYCRTYQQKFHSLTHLFHIISQQLKKQWDFVQKFMKMVIKYYINNDYEIKSFVLYNLGELYKILRHQFPIGFFIHSYTISPIAQSFDYELMNLISQDKQLLDHQVNGALRISTIYYYQQVHCSCFIEVLNHLMKHKDAVKWAEKISEEILNKWPNLDIPKLDKIPVVKPSNAIKFRSVGLKKKQMMKFKDYNKYKAVLSRLIYLQDKDFLNKYSKKLFETLIKIEKSKRQELKETKHWLINLIESLKENLNRIRHSPIEFICQNNTDISFLSQARYDSQLPLNLEDSDKQYNFIKQYQQKDSLFDQALEGQQNQFIIQPHQVNSSPLLPFTDEDSSLNPGYLDDNLFQNYELTYIKNIKEKYKRVLGIATNIYNLTSNVDEFISQIGLKPYLKNQLKLVQEILQSIKVKYESDEQISTNLMIQLGLIIFSFKKNRRISIDCLESFFILLEQKIKEKRQISDLSSINRSQKIITNMEFQAKISPKISKLNKIDPYIICFELLSDLLKQSFGFYQIEPISKLVNKIKNLKTSHSKILMQQPVFKQADIKQREKLEDMIQNESIIVGNTPLDNEGSSTFRKTVARIKNYSQQENKKKQEAESTKKNNKREKDRIKQVSEVKNKINKRRLELQGKFVQKNLNDSPQPL